MQFHTTILVLLLALSAKKIDLEGSLPSAVIFNAPPTNNWNFLAVPRPARCCDLLFIANRWFTLTTPPPGPIRSRLARASTRSTLGLPPSASRRDNRLWLAIFLLASGVESNPGPTFYQDEAKSLIASMTQSKRSRKVIAKAVMSASEYLHATNRFAKIEEELAAARAQVAQSKADNKTDLKAVKLVNTLRQTVANAYKDATSTFIASLPPRRNPGPSDVSLSGTPSSPSVSSPSSSAVLSQRVPTVSQEEIEKLLDGASDVPSLRDATQAAYKQLRTNVHNIASNQILLRNETSQLLGEVGSRADRLEEAIQDLQDFRETLQSTTDAMIDQQIQVTARVDAMESQLAAISAPGQSSLSSPFLTAMKSDLKSELKSELKRELKVEILAELRDELADLAKTAVVAEMAGKSLSASGSAGNSLLDFDAKCREDALKNTARLNSVIVVGLPEQETEEKDREKVAALLAQTSVPALTRPEMLTSVTRLGKRKSNPAFARSIRLVFLDSEAAVKLCQGKYAKRYSVDGKQIRIKYNRTQFHRTAMERLFLVDEYVRQTPGLPFQFKIDRGQPFINNVAVDPRLFTLPVIDSIPGVSLNVDDALAVLADKRKKN